MVLELKYVPTEAHVNVCCRIHIKKCVWNHLQLSESSGCVAVKSVSSLSSKCVCQLSCQRVELPSVSSMFNIPIVLDMLPSPDYVTAGGLWEMKLRFSTSSHTDSINTKLRKEAKAWKHFIQSVCLAPSVTGRAVHSRPCSLQWGCSSFHTSLPSSCLCGESLFNLQTPAPAALYSTDPTLTLLLS